MKKAPDVGSVHRGVKKVIVMVMKITNSNKQENVIAV